MPPLFCCEFLFLYLGSYKLYLDTVAVVRFFRHAAKQGFSTICLLQVDFWLKFLFELCMFINKNLAINWLLNSHRFMEWNATLVSYLSLMIA